MPITFRKRIPEDGKACFDALKNREFIGIIRYFAEGKDWAFLKYPSGRIDRFATMKEAKNEALKG